jgi:hypothetical protein
MAAKTNQYAAEIRELGDAMAKIIHAVGSQHFLILSLLTTLNDEVPDFRRRMVDALLMVGSYDRDAQAMIEEAINIIGSFSDRNEH